MEKLKPFTSNVSEIVRKSDEELIEDIKKYLQSGDIIVSKQKSIMKRSPVRSSVRKISTPVDTRDTNDDNLLVRYEPSKKMVKDIKEIDSELVYRMNIIKEELESLDISDKEKENLKNKFIKGNNVPEKLEKLIQYQIDEKYDKFRDMKISDSEAMSIIYYLINNFDSIKTVKSYYEKISFKLILTKLVDNIISTGLLIAFYTLLRYNFPILSYIY